jgi:hypothetical protein
MLAFLTVLSIAVAGICLAQNTANLRPQRILIRTDKRSHR